MNVMLTQRPPFEKTLLNKTKQSNNNNKKRGIIQKANNRRAYFHVDVKRRNQKLQKAGGDTCLLGLNECPPTPNFKVFANFKIWQKKVTIFRATESRLSAGQGME